MSAQRGLSRIGELGAPGWEESSAEQSQWLTIQEAEASVLASYPGCSFVSPMNRLGMRLSMYKPLSPIYHPLVCVENKTQAELWVLEWRLPAAYHQIGE